MAIVCGAPGVGSGCGGEAPESPAALPRTGTAYSGSPARSRSCSSPRGQGAEQLLFVTPGLRVSFDDAKDSGDAFTVETGPDVPLRIRGAVTPPPHGGASQPGVSPGGSRAYRGRIDSEGRFALPAICLDCLAAGHRPTPRSEQPLT